MNARKLYRVTREFTGGNLKGMVITQTTEVKQEVGREVKRPVAGSSYIIRDCKQIA